MDQGITVCLKCSIDRFKEIAAITTVSKDEKHEEKTNGPGRRELELGNLTTPMKITLVFKEEK